MIELLQEHLPEGSFEAAESSDRMPTIYVPRERMVDTSRALRDTPELRFDVLLDICGVDYLPRQPRFEVVYLLVAIDSDGAGVRPKRLRVKVRVPGEDPHVPTVSGIWPTANWAERELYDFFGILVDGHPDLRRILMPEDWDGFPMRRDYPVQIKEPVRTYSPLQVSEEEFLTNIEQSRAAPRKP